MINTLATVENASNSTSIMNVIIGIMVIIVVILIAKTIFSNRK